ncbi:hypothetical protein E1286_06890 [Nonomuraea terrae]|uniref:Cation-translocating P-type ATPase n=1 Tax=Nonomuraea terrae TaxID=2530383 RepID=A0A4R4Z5X9_9ACTN|nr:hypothetical protein [Nonomuraea terrae]TDD53483.1 hypothetical protein E1286_06890 [Nonomuraea terrae]
MTLLRGVLPDPLRGAVPCPRRLATCPGGLHIDLHGIGGPGTETAAGRLEEMLLEQPGVDRAEVNGRLGCVFVGCDPDEVDQDKLMAIVAELDEQEERARHTPIRLAEEHVRATIRLAAGVTGIGLAFAGRAAGLPRLTPAVPALLHLADSTPILREELDRLLGRRATNALFTSATMITQTLTLRPVALVVNALVSAGHYVEARAGRQAWELLEERLAQQAGAYRHIKTVARPRPCHRPHGPIERYADVASPAAAGGYAVTRVATRSRQRALAILISATPTVAAVSRDAFACAVSRALGRRGSIVLETETLRHMDRVDTVILDADAITTGSWTIDRLVSLSAGLDTGELYARCCSLIDFADPSRTRTGEDAVVEPVADLDKHLPAEAPEWRARGLLPIGVTREGRLVAVAGLAREIDPMAEAVVDTAKAATTVMLAGDDEALAQRLAIERLVPGGPELGDAVVELQSEGHCVVVVSRGSCQGLVHADIGVGVMDQSGTVPWDAHVAGDLTGAHLLLSCLPRAVRVSRNGVRLGAAAAVVGGLLVIAGPEATSLHRGQLVNAGASVMAVALGEWAGRSAGRVPIPSLADTTPRNATSAKDVLTRLHSSAHRSAQAEAVQRRGVKGQGGA